MNKKAISIDADKYRGEWLALHPSTHKVIAHNQSFRAAKQSAIKRGVSKPVLYAVPKSDAYFVGRS